MAMKQSELTMPVFADYSKAFDTIHFFTLIQKMYSLNFSTDFLYWVLNCLTHRQHFVQVDSNCSSLLTAKYGVLQGSILGPISFNLCVADMSSNTPNSNCIQYADDSTLYQSCKINQKDKSIKELGKDLISIVKWAIETNLRWAITDLLQLHPTRKSSRTETAWFRTIDKRWTTRCQKTKRLLFAPKHSKKSQTRHLTVRTQIITRIVNLFKIRLL